MSNITINITNESANIGGLEMSTSELQILFPTLQLPDGMLNMEYNSAAGERKCIAYSKDSVEEMPDSLKKQCVTILKNVGTYQSKLATLRAEQPKTLDEVKIEAIATVAAKRYQMCEVAPVVYDGNQYSSSQNARIAILYYMDSLNDTDAAQYPTMDKTAFTELKKVDFKAIANLISSRESSLRAKEIVALGEINSATQSSEIQQIVDNFGY